MNVCSSTISNRRVQVKTFSTGPRTELKRMRAQS